MPVGGITLPEGTDYPNGTILYPEELPTLTNAELQTVITDQVVANEAAYQALLDASIALYGLSALVLMPGEGTPRTITEGELTSLSGEVAIATTALSLLSGLSAGEAVIIGQNKSFQMIAFVHTWGV